MRMYATSTSYNNNDNNNQVITFVHSENMTHHRFLFRIETKNEQIWSKQIKTMGRRRMETKRLKKKNTGIGVVPYGVNLPACDYDEFVNRNIRITQTNQFIFEMSIWVVPFSVWQQFLNK